jgi:hypothetical protein
MHRNIARHPYDLCTLCWAEYTTSLLDCNGWFVVNRDLPKVFCFTISWRILSYYIVPYDLSF